MIFQKCELEIDLKYIEAFIKSKTLIYLGLQGNKIIEENATKITELNLKGINIDNNGLS